MIKHEMKPPSKGEMSKLIYQGREIEAEVFKVREYTGFVDYALIRPPHTDHPSVKISVWRVR